MRKFFALCLVALLSVTLALAVVSCGGGQQAEPPAQTETAPPSQTMAADTSMMADSAMADTSMGGH